MPSHSNISCPSKKTFEWPFQKYGCMVTDQLLCICSACAILTLRPPDIPSKRAPEPFPAGDPPRPPRSIPSGSPIGQMWYHANLDRKRAEALLKRYSKASDLVHYTHASYAWLQSGVLGKLLTTLSLCIVEHVDFRCCVVHCMAVALTIELVLQYGTIIGSKLYL